MSERAVWPLAALSGCLTGLLLFFAIRPELTPWIQRWVVDAGIAAIVVVDTVAMGWWVFPRFVRGPDTP